MDIYPRLPEPLYAMPKTIAAPCYNHARLALRRLRKNPLRVSLPGLRCLDVLLFQDLWLCVDTVFEDQPVLAWGEFKRPEAALHLPVACRLEFFHTHASLIMGEAADALDAALAALLRPESSPGAVVASIPSISRRSPTAAGPTP